MGLYLLGRGRVSRRRTGSQSPTVAVGSTLSAFWIIVATSWMRKTPAGFAVNAAAGKAELTDFLGAVFNPSTLIRYSHTVLAAVVAGSFFAAGRAAYVLLAFMRPPRAPGLHTSATS